MKKLIFLITLLCVSLSSWASDFTVGNINYNITSPVSPYTVAVTSRSSGYAGNKIIPSTVTSNDGITYTVTSIGSSAFLGCIGLTSVIIPNTVKTIGSSAFSGCTNLDSIVMPNSITSIAINAFNGCTGLKYVALSNSITSIGSSAFNGCTSLTKIVAKMTSLPTMVGSVFTNVNFTKCKLVVPIDKIYTYKGDGVSTEWGKFTNIVDGPTITTTKPTSITATTAISVGTADDDFEYPITERGVCWSSINQYPYISDNKLSSGSGIGTFTSSLKNLTPNTTYYIRGYVLNSNGNIRYDNVIYYFTTTLTNTAVNDVFLENINIYPNPTKGKVFIKSDTNFPMNSVVNLFSISGKKICSTIIQDNGLLFDLSDYNLKGMYLIQIMNKDNTVLINKKLIFE